MQGIRQSIVPYTQLKLLPTVRFSRAAGVAGDGKATSSLPWLDSWPCHICHAIFAISVQDMATPGLTGHVLQVVGRLLRAAGRALAGQEAPEGSSLSQNGKIQSCRLVRPQALSRGW